MSKKKKIGILVSLVLIAGCLIGAYAFGSCSEEPSIEVITKDEEKNYVFPETNPFE